MKKQKSAIPPSIDLILSICCYALDMSNLRHGINNTVTIVYPIYLGVAFVSYTFLFHRTLLETMLSITTEPNMFFLIYNIVKKKDLYQ